MIGMALFAVLVCVNFTSCDKEDEETATIYGEWRMVSDEYWRYEDGELAYHDLDEDYDEYIVIIRLDADGTFCGIEGGSEDSYEDKGTYSYKDGMLIVDGDEGGPYKVTTLTSTTLVLEVTYVSGADKEIYKMTYNRVK